MKFLVDECVGPTVAQWLKQKYDAISIYDHVRGIDDTDVLRKAFAENRILVTSDKDFGQIVFKNKKEHSGIILLRLVDERPANKIIVLESVLQNHAEELFCNFVVVTEKTIRVIKSSFLGN